MSDEGQQLLARIETIAGQRDDLMQALREIIAEARSGRSDALREIERIAAQAREGVYR